MFTQMSRMIPPEYSHNLPGRPEGRIALQHHLPGRPEGRIATQPSQSPDSMLTYTASIGDSDGDALVTGTHGDPDMAVVLLP